MKLNKNELELILQGLAQIDSSGVEELEARIKEELSFYDSLSPYDDDGELKEDAKEGLRENEAWLRSDT